MHGTEDGATSENWRPEAKSCKLSTENGGSAEVPGQVSDATEELAWVESPRAS